MAIAPTEFRQALGRFATGVTVMTVRAAGGDQGMTANAFTSLSLDPPLVLVCVQKSIRMHEVLLGTRSFAVSILARGQRALSDRFARTPGDGSDHFEGVATRRAAHSGALLLDGALAWVDCAVHGTWDGGDHTVFVGEVRGVELSNGAAGAGPLLFYSGAYWNIGAAA